MDYLLSAFYNDMTNKVYDTDSQIQEDYYRQMQKMIAEMRDIGPEFRQPEFTLRTQDEMTMAEWLSECVEGRPFDVGLHLMMKG